MQATWTFDSGASYHPTTDASLLIIVDSTTLPCIHTTDGTTLISQCGMITRVIDPSGWLTLPTVFVAPSICVNLILVVYLCNDGPDNYLLFDSLLSKIHTQAGRLVLDVDMEICITRTTCIPHLLSLMLLSFRYHFV